MPKCSKCTKLFILHKQNWQVRYRVQRVHETQPHRCSGSLRMRTNNAELGVALSAAGYSELEGRCSFIFIS